MNETPRQLESLVSGDFRSRFELIGTADGLYHALRRSPEVKTLNSALREEALTENELNQFVRTLLRSFTPGRQFDHQIAIAAIAVACEGIGKAFARQFIDFLADMQSPELMLASLVARHARRSITSTTSRTFTTVYSSPPWRMVDRVTRSDVGQCMQTFERELV